MWLGEAASLSEIILEVGTFKGRSAKVLSKNTPGTLVCCDPWGTEKYIFDNGHFTGINTDVLHVFKQNLEKEIASRKVRIVQGKFLEYPWPSNFRPDFIFLDGDHRYEIVKQEIELAKKMIKPGGILAGHDYGDQHWPGVKVAVDEAFGDKFHLVETIWIKGF